jgi:hypothetical protein
MNFNDALISMELVLESGGVPLLIGESGIGKTALVKKLSEKGGYYCIIIDGNMLKEGEIGGLPTIEEYEVKIGENIVKKKRTVYAIHTKLQEIETQRDKEPERKVLLFIDEINRCEHSVQQELMNIILNREINGYELPDNVVVVAAMNPSSKYEAYGDSEYVVVDMDPAQEDRFVWIEMEVDVRAWLSWGMENNEKGYVGLTNIEQDILGFIAAFPEYLHTPKSTEMVKATPRSWERVSNCYRIYLRSKDRIPQNIFYNVVKGNVGPSIAQEFCSYIEGDKESLITPEEIFVEENINELLKMRLKGESHSRLYLIARNALHYLNSLQQKDKEVNTFIELLQFYPADLRMAIMKEIRLLYENTLYSCFINSDAFVEAFFSMYV